MSAPGVGDQVVVHAHRAWRRGRIWKIDRNGTLYVGVRIPTSGTVRSVRVTLATARPVDFEPGSAACPSLETPAPELLEIVKAIR